MQTLTQDQYWELFQKISDELKETMFSEKTAENIFDICDRNGLELPDISNVARYTGRVLLGILPPNDFQTTIEKDLGINGEQAKNISTEINRFIFYPVKNSLAEFYSGDITPKGSSENVKGPIEENIPQPTEPRPSSGSDSYRETIE